MLILIAGEKGGSGKSTIAVQLGIERAKAGKSVLVVDGDPQATASNWLKRRKNSGLKPPVPYQKMQADDFNKELQKLVDKYDDIIIDIAGRDSEEMRQALMFVDIVLFPLRPTKNDLETAGNMDALIGRFLEKKTYLQKALFVISQSSPNPFRKSTTLEAKDYLSECGNIDVCESVVCLRASHERASIEGASVSELSPPDRKAKNEFLGFYKEIFNG